MNKSTKYLLVSLFTFLIGYIFLKLAYNSTQDIPFLQEIVLIILGTIATIAITAALLNKQSEVELEKEQRVKIFDLKSNLYFELIDFIEEIVGKRKITKEDLITLEFLTHKISTIASPEVLKEYSNFLNNIKDSSKDAIISPFESDELSQSLANLCGTIRYDLISKEASNKNEIQTIINKNIDKL